MHPFPSSLPIIPTPHSRSTFAHSLRLGWVDPSPGSGRQKLWPVPTSSLLLLIAEEYIPSHVWDHVWCASCKHVSTWQSKPGPRSEKGILCSFGMRLPIYSSQSVRVLGYEHGTKTLDAKLDIMTMLQPLILMSDLVRLGSVYVTFLLVLGFIRRF
jgi:hypothetical protein